MSIPILYYYNENDNRYQLIYLLTFIIQILLRGGTDMVRLHTNELTVAYGEQTIIDKLSVEIPDQKITAIIGSNGCGKSTLLKAMTRIIAHKSGQIVLDGKTIASEHTKILAKKLAILPQTQDHSSGLTVGELVSYGRFPYQSGFGRLSKQDYDVIDWALEVTGITDYKYRSVDALSGGQRQRVWIAMALAQETDMIFLDEPTTYLDMAHQLEVLELLQQLNVNQQRTIIMVLHDLNHAARFADYVIAMRNGHIVKRGSAQEVITPEVLQEVYHIDAEIGIDPRTGKPICITYELLRREVQNSHL